MADSIPANTITQPAPLLTLASEILEMILIKHFEGASIVVKKERPDEYPKRPRILGMPSLSIERVCKRLRAMSYTVRTKHVTHKLITEHGSFFESVMPDSSNMDGLKWIREHITLMQAALPVRPPEPDLDQVVWDSFVTVFPNLMDIKLHDEVWVLREGSSKLRRYMPLDSDATRRSLARDIVTSDWIGTKFIGTIREQLYRLEKAYHYAKYWSLLLNHSSGLFAADVNITFKLTTYTLYGSEGQRAHIYDVVTTYKSEGWKGHDSSDDFGLITLSKTCRAGDFVERFTKDIDESGATSTSSLNHA